MTRDYVREMMDQWTAKGDQEAYDVGWGLLSEIEKAIDGLKKQDIAIRALEKHLEGLGVTPRAQAPALDTVALEERPRLIAEAALKIWHGLPSGYDLIKAQDVQQELRKKGLDLGVKHPLAVIGTVLSNSDEFRRVARNSFEYVGHPEPPDDIDDLPF